MMLKHMNFKYYILGTGHLHLNELIILDFIKAICFSAD